MQFSELKGKYSSFFSINEIGKSKYLQAIFYFVSFGLLVTFNYFPYGKGLIHNPVLGQITICPSYFQSCHFFNPFDTMIRVQLMKLFVFASIFISVMSGFFNKWHRAHFFLLLVFIIKFIVAFFLIQSMSVPFVYFQIGILIPLLFAKNKINSARVIFALLYILSGFVKFNDSWIAGAYFASLRDGLYLFPKSTAPLFTNLVIFMELFGTVLLFSSTEKVRRAFLYIYSAFHLYSIIYVSFRYPIYCLPFLYLLFWEAKPIKLNFFKENILTTVLSLALVFFNLFHFFIPGDVYLTDEGLRLSINMFDSNKQCVIKSKKTYSDGNEEESTYENDVSWNRCSLYHHFKVTQLKCNEDNIEKVSLSIDYSKNGDPFYRFVEEENICGLSFKFFGKNVWIKTDSTEILGYPQQNQYGDYTNRNNIIFKDPQYEHSSTVKFLKRNTETISWIYFISFIIFLIVGFRRAEN